MSWGDYLIAWEAIVVSEKCESSSLVKGSRLLSSPVPLLGPGNLPSGEIIGESVIALPLKKAEEPS